MWLVDLSAHAARSTTLQLFGSFRLLCLPYCNDGALRRLRLYAAWYEQLKPKRPCSACQHLHCPATHAHLPPPGSLSGCTHAQTVRILYRAA